MAGFCRCPLSAPGPRQGRGKRPRRDPHHHGRELGAVPGPGWGVPPARRPTDQTGPSPPPVGQSEVDDDHGLRDHQPDRVPGRPGPARPLDTRAPGDRGVALGAGRVLRRGPLPGPYRAARRSWPRRATLRSPRSGYPAPPTSPSRYVTTPAIPADRSPPTRSREHFAGALPGAPVHPSSAAVTQLRELEPGGYPQAPHTVPVCHVH